MLGARGAAKRSRTGVCNARGIIFSAAAIQGTKTGDIVMMLTEKLMHAIALQLASIEVL